MQSITGILSPSVQIHCPREVPQWARSGPHDSAVARGLGTVIVGPSRTHSSEGAVTQRNKCSRAKGEEIRAEKYIRCPLEGGGISYTKCQVHPNAL